MVFEEKSINGEKKTYWNIHIYTGGIVKTHLLNAYLKDNFTKNGNGKIKKLSTYISEKHSN